MRASGIFTLVCVLWQAFQGLGAADLSSYHDATRALENPHKGWYHHYWDNGDWGYGGSVSDITSVPGLDFVYIRMAWSFFEKTDNSYDWSYISDVADTYGPKGYKVVVCFTGLETGASNDSRYEPEVDATVHYATPCWVKDKGCSGSWEEAYGKWHWQPDWDDPIYLAELEDFYREFYDTFGGEPWLKLMDMGSIGEWGEGHCGHTTHKYVPTVAEVKANIDVYNSVFQQNGIQVTIGDDYAAWGKSESEKNAIADYANARGFGWTDLSIGNWYWQERHSSTYGVANPELFENHYLNAPVTMEMGHYHLRISDKFNTWSEPDGSAVYGEPGYGDMTHYDILTKQIETMHASYASMHGHIDKWLPDNSNTIRTLGNLLGYWYFIDEATWGEGTAPGDEWSFSLDWYNRGVAPAYNTYQLKLKLDGPSPKTFTIDDSKNKDWIDGERETESYSVTLPGDMSSGTYDVKLKLYDPQTDRDVDLGFVTSIKDADGYFDLGETTIGTGTAFVSDAAQHNAPYAGSVRVRLSAGTLRITGVHPKQARGITLTDARGRSAAIREAVGATGTIEVSTADRPGGVYMVCVRSRGHVHTAAVVLP